MSKLSIISVVNLKIGDFVALGKGEDEAKIVSIVELRPKKRTITFEDGREEDFCVGKYVTGIVS